jgi:hypothetical protein
MARKRMLSVAFFSSRPVNELSYTAMVTFAGLWTYFDDFGRGEDDAALVKAAVWPRRRAMSEAKVAADLDLIAGRELICRYEIAGVPLIHSPSWHEHQTISHPTASKLPPCPMHEPGLYHEYLRERGDGRDRFRNHSGAAQESLLNGSGRSPPQLRAHVRTNACARR